MLALLWQSTISSKHSQHSTQISSEASLARDCVHGYARGFKKRLQNSYYVYSALCVCHRLAPFMWLDLGDSSPPSPYFSLLFDGRPPRDQVRLWPISRLQLCHCAQHTSPPFCAAGGGAPTAPEWHQGAETLKGFAVVGSWPKNEKDNLCLWWLEYLLATGWNDS